MCAHRAAVLCKEILPKNPIMYHVRNVLHPSNSRKALRALHCREAAAPIGLQVEHEMHAWQCDWCASAGNARQLERIVAGKAPRLWG